VCYSGAQRLVLQPELAVAPAARAGGDV